MIGFVLFGTRVTSNLGNLFAFFLAFMTFGVWFMWVSLESEEKRQLKLDIQGWFFRRRKKRGLIKNG
jgi:hypothetical protein